ncbi:MAG: hypothetical protein WC517_03955 [Patescibacteria group bacterium]
MKSFFRNEDGVNQLRLRAGAGFTLIELLIAVGIFIIISSLIIVNYHVNEKVKTLENQAQIVVAGLERVQTMALTGELVDDRSPLAYKFSISNHCMVGNCSVKLSAVFSNNEEFEFAEIPLSIAKISNASAAPVLFYPPRGKMELPGLTEGGTLEIYTQGTENKFCVKLNSVSGRLSLSSIISGHCDGSL